MCSGELLSCTEWYAFDHSPWNPENRQLTICSGSCLTRQLVVVRVYELAPTNEHPDLPFSFLVLIFDLNNTTWFSRDINFLSSTSHPQSYLNFPAYEAQVRRSELSGPRSPRQPDIILSSQDTPYDAQLPQVLSAHRPTSAAISIREFPSDVPSRHISNLQVIILPDKMPGHHCRGHGYE